jgi:hypothetical protein
VPRSDAFALTKSGLNPFLFAEVGTELNGSTLTILSVLARLGQDPWAEAARWAKLPRAAIIDCLAQSISQMPLCPQALTDARLTASRLILLLPAYGGEAPSGNRPARRLATLPRWLPVALVLGAVVFGILINTMVMQAGKTSQALTDQTFVRLP